MSHRGRDHSVLADEGPGTHSSPYWSSPVTRGVVPAGCGFRRPHPHKNHAPPFHAGSLRAEEFWPSGGAVAAVSSGVRIQEAGKPGVQDPARRSTMSEGEARQSEDSMQAGAVTVSDVQELIRRKEEIEAQIKANYDVLESQKGVGMNEPLVDCEGYPRSDVDLYQVRTARHNIVCLQNDHKAVMKQVEEALHQLHARDKEKQARDTAEAHKEAMSRNLGQSEGLSPPQAFAKVNSISPGSPASIAGLQVDDEIVEFGSVNTQNFQSLHNIGSVVQHSEGKPLNVTVIRRGEKHQLRLVPTRWAGKGLLGCNIIPLQR